MSHNVTRLLELSQNLLRKNLSELDTHLIYLRNFPVSQHVGGSGIFLFLIGRTVRVDTPDSTLNEDLVFVQSDQCAYIISYHLSLESRNIMRME